MSIVHFLDQSFRIYRLRDTVGHKQSYVSTLTIDIHIQAVSDEETLQKYGMYDAAFKGYVDEDSPIQEGDRGYDDDGLYYEVVNIITKEYGFAMNKHREVILKQIIS